jgi:hypothetical protein
MRGAWNDLSAAGNYRSAAMAAFNRPMIFQSWI